jgi:hypothetical protein
LRLHHQADRFGKAAEIGVATKRQSTHTDDLLSARAFSALTILMSESGLPPTARFGIVHGAL